MTLFGEWVVLTRPPAWISPQCYRFCPLTIWLFSPSSTLPLRLSTLFSGLSLLFFPCHHYCFRLRFVIFNRFLRSLASSTCLSLGFARECYGFASIVDAIGVSFTHRRTRFATVSFHLPRSPRYRSARQAFNPKCPSGKKHSKWSSTSNPKKIR